MREHGAIGKRLSAVALVVGLSLGANPVKAGIAISDAASGTTGSNPALSKSFTVGSGAKVLVVDLAWNASGTTIPACSWNGTPMTCSASKATPTATYRLAATYYLFNPAAGLHNVTATITGAGQWSAVALTLAGVDTTAVVQAGSWTIGSVSNPATINIASVPANAAAVIGQINNTDCILSGGGNQVTGFAYAVTSGLVQPLWATLNDNGVSKSAVCATLVTNLAAGTWTVNGSILPTGGSNYIRNTMVATVFAPAADAGTSAPTVANTGVDGITATNAYLHGNLSSTGTAATAVTVFWGKTDPFPATNGWDGSYSFGNNVNTGLLVATAAGLVGNTPYYYRYFATNSAGASWATQGTFTTLADSPAFTGVSATPVGGGTSASLSGTVTGIAPITVTAFWGLTDGSTNIGNWANATNIGVVAPGAAGIGIATGLTVGSNYYYRFMGSNAAGIGWSASGTTFRAYNNTVLSWTNTAATGSWGATGSWDHPPLFDGTEDALCGVASTATINSTLDGDRKLNSLSLGGAYAFNLSTGSVVSSKLILMSGNLTATNTGGYASIAVPIQVGDGTTPISNAVWNFAGGASALALNRILGGAGTLITVTNNRAITTCPKVVVNNATNYLGDWVLSAGAIQLRADNALGLGHITLLDGAGLCNGEAPTTVSGVSVIISNDVALTGGTVKFAILTNTTLTLAGNLTGTGTVTCAGVGNFHGVLKIAGTNNSASGDWILNKVLNPEGFQIDLVGTWTNAGTFDLSTQWGPGTSVQGNGSLGMGPNKKVKGGGTYGLPMFIVPSDGTPIYFNANALLVTNGTIGTLTIGTPGNNNSVEFPSNSWLLATVNATTSSTLMVNGLLNILTNASAVNSLTINGTLSSTRSYTLARFSSRSNKFTRVYWSTNQVANPEAKGAINGTHTLVYSATDLQLVSCAQQGAVIFMR